MRALPALLSTVALGALLPASAQAVARPTIGHEAKLGGPHVLFHYSSQDVPTSTISPLLQAANAAYTEYATYGLNAPVSDGSLGGDSRIDYYICTPDTQCDAPDAFGGRTRGDDDAAFGGGAPTTAFVLIDTVHTATADNYQGQVAAHEQFHVWQHAQDQGPQSATTGIREWTAEWASHRIVPVSYTKDSTGPGLVLSSTYGGICPVGASPRPPECETAQYPYWPFVEDLTTRFGDAFIREFAAATKGQTDPFVSLGRLLAPHGTTLADAWAAFARRAAVGGIGSRYTRSQPLYGYQRVLATHDEVSVPGLGIASVAASGAAKTTRRVGTITVTGPAQASADVTIIGRPANGSTPVAAVRDATSSTFSLDLAPGEYPELQLFNTSTTQATSAVVDTSLPAYVPPPDPPTPTGGGDPPTPPPTPSVLRAVGHGKLVRAKGKVKLPVRCDAPAGAECFGVAYVYRPGAKKELVHVVYDLAGGKTATVSIPLSARTLKAARLGRAKQAKLRFVLVTDDTTITSTRKVKL